MRSLFSVLLPAALVVAACRAPTEAPALAEPSQLGLYIGDIRVSRTSTLGMLPGDSLQFVVRLTDASGQRVSGVHTNLVSRNALAVTMDTLGVARVAGRGASWIVGSVLTPARNVLADSALVNVVCTTDVRPGIALTVVDSLTGLGGPMSALKITIRDGAAGDSVLISTLAAGAAPFSIGLAWERKGTYQLDVTAAGYAPWSRANVAVTAGICHVTTVVVTARLQRP